MKNIKNLRCFFLREKNEFPLWNINYFSTRAVRKRGMPVFFNVKSKPFLERKVSLCHCD
jgi:hypothetical protein